MVLKVKRVKIQYVRGRELSKSQFSWQTCQAAGFKGVSTAQDFDQDFLFILKENRVGRKHAIKIDNTTSDES